MDRKAPGGLCLAALLIFLLAGCAHPAPTTPNTETPGQRTHAMQRPARAIIYFQRQLPDNQKLSAAISDACHCQPVFFRPYLGDALIYEIALPPDYTFAAFEAALMLQADKFGIKAVEQDGVMQHQ